MEKKNSIAKNVIHVTLIRWVNLEFFLVIFLLRIPLIKDFPIKLSPGVFPSWGIVGVAPGVLLGTPV